MKRLQVPDTTIRAVEVLFWIENALRELIIDELSLVAGSRWYKQRIPGDILKKYREGVTYERSIKWVQLIPHHPIYYVDFPDLRKIISRSDNWSDSFQRIFTNLDVFEGTLIEVEFIRNKVAHNRMVSAMDLQVLDGAHAKLAASIGDERFASLVKRCTHLEDLRSGFTKLAEELDSTFESCKQFRPCSPLKIWKEMAGDWWFDEDYLGSPIAAVSSYFDLIEAYIALPRSRGEGHRIERWVKESGLEQQYECAKEQTEVFL